MTSQHARLEPDAVRNLFAHANPVVRACALDFFCDPPVQDATILPAILDVIDAHKEHSDWLKLPSRAMQLPMSTETVARLIELANDEAMAHIEGRSLCKDATVSSLAANMERLQSCGAFDEWELDIVRERIELLSVDPEQCWHELNRLCATHCHEATFHNMPETRSSILIEACARHPERFKARVLDVLGRTYDLDGRDFETPAVWLEPICCELAGLSGLHEAEIKIVGKLLNVADDDYIMSEACITALKRLGSPDIVGWLADVAPRAHDWLDIVSVLAGIRTAESTIVMLDLAEATDDPTILTLLALGTLEHFDARALLAARAIVATGRWDAATVDITATIEAMSDVFGVDVPERALYAKMRQRRSTQPIPARMGPRASQLEEGYGTEAEREEMSRLVEVDCEKYGEVNAPILLERRYEGDSTLRVNGMLERVEQMDFSASMNEPGAMPTRGYQPPEFIPGRQRVGPNDPCICGSGKKFKKCCMGN